MPAYEINAQNPLWVKGWGVFRSNPWDFDGLFVSISEAEARKLKLGADYEVQFGSRHLATSDFIVEDFE